MSVVETGRIVVDRIQSLKDELSLSKIKSAIRTDEDKSWRSPHRKTKVFAFITSLLKFHLLNILRTLEK